MDLAGATVAVTGATGFLGRYVVDVLLGRSAKVIGVVRNPGRAPELVRRGVEMRKADLAAEDELAAGFAGASAVVSNAALFSLHNQRWTDHERTNVEGTGNVFAAVARAGVKRVVHVSSVAVYRASGSNLDEAAEQHDERSVRRPWTVYAISKALSEQLAWRLAGEHGIALTTVRPCVIYGAHDPNFLPILRWLLWPPITLVPAIGTMPFVHAGDVAEAIALCLEKPASVGKAYNVTGEAATVWELVDAWRRAGGATPWLRLPLPVPMRQGYDHSLATRDLGWRNRPLVDGLRETLERERAARA